MRGLGYGASRAPSADESDNPGARQRPQPATWGYAWFLIGLPGTVIICGSMLADALSAFNIVGGVYAIAFLVLLVPALWWWRGVAPRYWSELQPLSEHPGDPMTESPARANPKHHSVRDRREV